MNIVRTAFIVLLCLLCPALCFGQAAKTASLRRQRPDFSGTWTLDKMERKGHRQGLPPQIEITLVVTHHEPEIEVSRTAALGTEERQREFVYYTDGRSEYIPSLSDYERYQCSSKWDKSKLISKCVAQFRHSYNRREISLKEEFTETWELSLDGKTLTQKIKFAPERRGPRDAFKKLPPGLRESAERERTTREMLEPTDELKNVFRRAP
jgi:hypothetical protein